MQDWVNLFFLLVLPSQLFCGCYPCLAADISASEFSIPYSSFQTRSQAHEWSPASLAPMWEGRMVLKAAQQDASPNSPLPVPAGGWDRLHLGLSLTPRAADGICLVKLIKLLPALSDKRQSQVAACLLSIFAVLKRRKSVVFFLNVEKKIGHI